MIKLFTLIKSRNYRNVNKLNETDSQRQIKTKCKLISINKKNVLENTLFMTEHSNLNLSSQEERNEAFIKISLVLVWWLFCICFVLFFF